MRDCETGMHSMIADVNTVESCLWWDGLVDRTVIKAWDHVLKKGLAVLQVWSVWSVIWIIRDVKILALVKKKV